MMLDEARCRLAIAEGFPQLDLRSVRYFAGGWDYELWEVNGELLFRFPLREECAGPLEREARLLAAIAGALPLPGARAHLPADRTVPRGALRAGDRRPGLGAARAGCYSGSERPREA
ncbi:MAG: hypothetical protein HY723_06815 [Chloroflexi bacterium]|nr:hypothetical protein [Chloroflexota bacterium]